ncbi:MAG: hypothetical protein ABFQ82_00150 [Thermodesulfobacteriota bacterium]
MANIRESRLAYQVNNHWIHVTAPSEVEFDQEELGSDWLFRFILKKSDTEPEKQMIMSAHSEPFKADGKNMRMEPAIKIRLSHDNADWGEREISGEICLIPFDDSNSFSHGKYKLPAISVSV